MNEKPKTPVFRLEEIGPTKAAQYLEHNEHNRQVKRNHVLQLAEQMKKGLWVTNNQTIGFDWNGNLTDGQHRLMAIVESGATITIGVTRNLSPNAKKVTDRDQIGRSAADVFYMRGEAKNLHCQTLQAAINVLHRFSFDGRYRNRKDKIYQDQYDTYLLHYPQLKWWTDWVYRVGHPTGMQRGTLVGLGVVFSLAAKKAGVEADFFMEQVVTGAGTTQNSPIVLLRERCMRSAFDRESRLTPHAIGWLTIKVWNALAEGEVMKSLKIRSNENPPHVFGFDYTALPYYEGKK